MKHVELVEWSAKDGSIQLEMLGEDQEVHSLAMSAECAGAVAAALGTELEKLEAQGKGRQLIRPTGMQTGKTEQGEPMLFLTFKGGTELPLVFKYESLGVLISELQKLAGVIQPASQVRWN